MPVIDADAHVIETERTWDFLEPSERKYRPTLAPPLPGSTRARWMVEGKQVGFRFQTLTEQEVQRREAAGRPVVTSQALRELDDVGLRVADMDRLGIDVQVLHNTIAIQALTEDPAVDVALCRAWNRWLAEIWKQGKGRLRWSMLPPIHSMPDALDEIRQARENGAVAVCLRPVEGERLLVDEDFYPIFDLAQQLDMAIAVHIANGNPTMTEIYGGADKPGGGFSTFRIPTVAACQQLLMSEVPRQFPRLRWGFIEASANWVPWVVADVKERMAIAGRAAPDSLLEENRVYVTCQTNDDLPFVLKHAGEHSLVIGSDYGHFDASSELDAITVLKQASELPADTIKKIVDDNPRALYGL